MCGREAVYRRVEEPVSMQARRVRGVMSELGVQPDETGRCERIDS